MNRAVSRLPYPLVVLVIGALVMAGCDGPPAVRSGASKPSAAPASPSSPPPEPSPLPSPKPLTKAQIALAKVLAKLPAFPAAPPAVPIAMPPGPGVHIYYHMPVTAKVAFLTIDDGLVQMPSDLTLMAAAHIPFTMFLIGPVGAKNPPFFTKLVADGGMVEDHTLTHPDLKGRSYAAQKHEICGARTMLAHAFGRAPVLFRPPYGDYDSTTLKVARDCGLKAAFYWSETARNGKVFYQTAEHKIKPGDIILMHFRDTFASDLLAALTAIHKSGLTPALLEDYIAPNPAGKA